MKIVFRDRPPRAGVIDEVRARFPQLEIEEAADDETFRTSVQDADAAIGGKWDEALLAHCKRLAWVQNIYAGVDDLPLESFAARGITVTNFRGISAVSLSEHVLGLMLAFARGLPEFHRRQAQSTWLPQVRRPRLFELQGQRVGLLGIGPLGAAIADRCHALGMHVVLCYRTQKRFPASVSEALPMSQLETMLAGVDHLVLCLPSNASTRFLMNGERFAALKDGAYVYNVGRGDAIDPEGMLRALRDGRLAGAGLDVTHPEPLPADSPLWSMSNVVITGHTAGISEKRWDRGMELILDNIQRFSRQQPLVNVVGAD